MTLEEQTSERALRLGRKGGFPVLCGFSRRLGKDAGNRTPFPVMLGKSDVLPPQRQDLRGATLVLDLGPRCLRRLLTSLLVLVPTEITCPCPCYYWGSPERSRNGEESTAARVTPRPPVALQSPHWPSLTGNQKVEGKWNWQSSVTGPYSSVWD